MTTIGHEARSLHKREMSVSPDCQDVFLSVLFLPLSTRFRMRLPRILLPQAAGCPRDHVDYRIVGDTRIERVFSVPITDTELEALSD